MLITDHIKLIPESPNRGPNHDELGPRFFDMGSAYNKRLQNTAREAAKTIGLNLREGVYMLFSGPNFETPAEVRFARIAGAVKKTTLLLGSAIASQTAGMALFS